MMKCAVGMSLKKDKNEVLYLLLVNNDGTPMAIRDLWIIVWIMFKDSDVRALCLFKLTY